MAFDPYNKTTLDFFAIQTPYTPRWAGLCPLLLLGTPCPHQRFGPETIHCCPQRWSWGLRWRPWKTSCGCGGEQRSCEDAWDELSEPWRERRSSEWALMEDSMRSVYHLHTGMHIFLFVHHSCIICSFFCWSLLLLWMKSVRWTQQYTWQIIHLHLIQVRGAPVQQTAANNLQAFNL